MIDQERLTPIEIESDSECESVNEVKLRSSKNKKSKRSKKGGGRKNKVNDRDDLSGMMLNMIGKIDIRELIILWLTFLFIHTPTFVTHFLKKIKGTYNPDSLTMTMKGTFYSSMFMMIVVVLCTMMF